MELYDALILLIFLLTIFTAWFADKLKGLAVVPAIVVLGLMYFASGVRVDSHRQKIEDFERDCRVKADRAHYTVEQSAASVSNRGGARTLLKCNIGGKIDFSNKIN